MFTDFLTRNFAYTASIIILAGVVGWNTYTIRTINRRIDSDNDGVPTNQEQ